MRTIYTRRDSIHPMGNKRQRVGSSTEVDAGISGWIAVSKDLSWYFWATEGLICISSSLFLSSGEQISHNERCKNKVIVRY